MITLKPQAGHLIQINIMRVKPGRAAELLALLNRAGRELEPRRNLPGFISSCRHVSLDGKVVMAYSRWRSQEDLEAARHHPLVVAARQEVKELLEQAPEQALYDLRDSDPEETPTV